MLVYKQLSPSVRRNLTLVGSIREIVNKLHCKKVVSKWSAHHQLTTTNHFFTVQLVQYFLLCNRKRMLVRTTKSS